MAESIPGPNPDWGVLWTLREDPLDFILYARTRSAAELAEIRFTARWLTEEWKLYSGRTYRPSAMKAVAWTQTPTPAGGAPKTKIFDANGLLAWVKDLARINWGASSQQDRDLYRMARIHWKYYQALLPTQPFEAAIRYLKAYGCLALLEEHYPGAPYTLKARDFLAQVDT